MKPETEDRLRGLIAFARDNDLTEIAWADGPDRIAFRRAARRSRGGPRQEDGVAAPTVREEVMRSPVVGTFRRAVRKDRPPLVVEGNHVKPGDRLGIVECMKIPNDVVALCAGRITQILVEDGQTVEYGQPVIVIEPTEPKPASRNGVAG